MSQPKLTLAKTLLLQRLIRGAVARHRARKLRDSKNQRERIISSLIELETRYVANLKLVVKVRAPLITSTGCDPLRSVLGTI